MRGGPRKDGRAGRAGEGACQAVQSWHLCRLYASSLQQGPIPSVLRREDAATVLIHGCGSSATSCGSVACVVVILSKAREAMRSVCAVSWLKEFGRRTSLFAVRKGRGARGGRADRGRSCPTMPPSVRTSDKTSNQDRIATSMPTRQKNKVGDRSPEFPERVSYMRKPRF